MTTLATYLRTDYLTDTKQLDRIQKVIESVIPIFVDRMVPAGNRKGVRTWPYLLKQGEDPEARKFSYSTHCMILFALNAILLGIDRSSLKSTANPVLFPRQIRAPKMNLEDVSSVVTKAMRDLLTMLKLNQSPFVWSHTFGDNDPMTLSWIAELLLRPPADVKVDGAYSQKVRTVAREVCSRGQNVLRFETRRNKEGERDVNPHCFLWLRLQHLAKLAPRLRRRRDGPEPEPIRTKEIGAKTFEDELHRQLGYFVVPDSRFDPAVLVFALEGALQFDPQGVSESTIESLFQTLEESQKRNPYWRPMTPFLGNSQGMVLFPVSVEISNSLLRSYEILHKAKRPTHFSRLEALLRRYAQWLLARAERSSYVVYTERGAREPRQAVGWHSEHVNQPGTIHMWETSQVLLFLVHYWSLLQRKIAAEGLAYAGLRLREWEEIDRVETYWRDEPLVALSQGRRTADGNGPHYAVLARIRRDFIDKRKPRSLLLYGPPGTGKTTVAEQMACSLKRPLLIITVSDFLASGAAEVEARAKGVFRVLQEQEDIVILFDEIDQFLLDRSSDAYRQQEGSIFQFLTPGMLTKFQDLREAKRSVFIVATNYVERIDSAIKRQGRIDDQLLLSLPDKRRRREFLWMFLCKKLTDLKAERSWPEYIRRARNNRAAWRIVKAAQRQAMELREDKAAKRYFDRVRGLDELLRKTVWFGFGDIKHLVENRLKIEPGDTWDKIGARLVSQSGGVQPSVKLSVYASRFDRERNEQVPSEELAILLYLVGECGARVSTEDAKVISKILDAEPKDKIIELLPATDTNVRKRVDRAMADVLASASP